MAAFDFPSSPSVNQTYTANGVTWKWNGTIWMRVSGAGYLEKIEEGNSKIEVDDSGSGNVTVTTDGTERFRVTSAGNVGIGTDNPVSGKLHVQDGNIRISGLSEYYLKIRNDNAGYDANISQADDGSLRYQYGSTEALRVDSSGRVLLGTTTVGDGSADNLTIADVGHCGMTIRSGTSSVGGIYLGDGTSGSDQYRGFIEYNHSGDHLRLGTNSAERLRITSGGSVAIGGVTPSDKLHVGGNNAFIRVDRPNGNPGLTLIYNSTNSTRADIDVTTGGDLRFATNNSTERLRIDSDGRISAGGASAATNAWSGGDDLVIGSATSGKRTGITLVSGDDSDGGIYWSDGTGANVYRGQLAYNHASDTMAFYTAASSKLSIDTNGHMRLSSGDLRVGDNTDSNAGSLTISVGSVSSGSGGIGIFANPTDGNSFVQFGDGTSTNDQYRGYMNYRHADDSLRFGTTNTDRLLIDSSGRVMIGQTSAYSATDTGTMMLTVTKNGSNRTDAAISNQFSGDNAGAALVLATHGQDYIIEATGSGNTTDGTRAFRILKGNDERFRIDTSGNKYTNSGAIGHGSGDYTNFASAGRTSNNNISIRAGSPNAGTSPTNSNSAIKIYPAGVRSTTTGNLTGGIAWQHLDPDNGTWDSNYGPGAQMWMGAALHDTPGQERGRFNLWMNSQTSGGSQPNNLAIEAYPNGMVRHPKVPAFMVRNSNNANAFTANSIATWNVTIFNNGSGFANGKFTAPIDGLYFFSCMMLSNASTRLFHDFRVNGTQVTGTRSETHAVANSYTTATISMVYNLSASDYVEVYVANNNAYGGNYANFNGYLIG